MTRDELADMTKYELTKMGQERVPPLALSGMTKGDMIEALASEAIVDKDGNELSAEQPVAAPASMPKEANGLRNADGTPWSGRMMRVKIGSTQQERGVVSVEINNASFRIRRDEWVVVPEPVVEVLRHSVFMMTEQDPETLETRRYPVQNYPFEAQAAN